MAAIIDRIVAESGIPDLFDVLGEKLPFADLQSLLLEVYRRRAAKRTPAQVLAEYERTRLFGVGAGFAEMLEIRQLVEVVFADAFDLVDLSPVTPLATSSAVAPISPDWSIAALHGSEVVSDPTNVLALEAALRRRKLLEAAPKSAELVHLGTVQRVVRPQRYADPTARRHFTLLALVTAGRDQGSLVFEAEALGLHVDAHLRFIRAYLGQSGALRVTYTIAGSSPTDDRRLVAIRGACERHGVALAEEQNRDTDGYYKGLCFHIFTGRDGGEQVQLSDGGFVDWTAKLLANAKERLLISGMGVEFLPGLRGSR